MNYIQVVVLAVLSCLCIIAVAGATLYAILRSKDSEVLNG
jgi:hypothetical protein